MLKPIRMHARDLELLGWRRQRCWPSSTGLCEVGESVIFPFEHPPVVGENLEFRCSSVSTGRMVTTGGRYDVSACDVVDAETDYVLHEQEPLQR